MKGFRPSISMNSSAACCLLLAVLATLCQTSLQAPRPAAGSESLCQELSRSMRSSRSSSPAANLKRAGSLLQMAQAHLTQIRSDLSEEVTRHFQHLGRSTSDAFARTMAGFPEHNPLGGNGSLTAEEQLCLARRLLKDAVSAWSSAESRSPAMSRLSVTSRLQGQPSCLLRLAQESVSSTPEVPSCRGAPLFPPLPAGLDVNNYLDLAFHKVRRILRFLSTLKLAASR